MTFRSKVVIMRPGVAEVEYDPALIGDIPDDADTVFYVLGIIVDPLDATKRIAAWVPLTATGLTGGYGFYGVD